MTETTRPVVPGRLDGRVAVVTGGASGIGLASVRRMAAEGAKIVVADIDPIGGKIAANEVDGLYVNADVTSEADVQRLFATAMDTYGSVDIAFNNAGISPPEDDSILTTDLAAWQRVQQVNLTSVFLCSKYAIEYMRAAGRGSVINTASFVAVLGSATSQISYTASKGGVLALSRELGVQFAREGVRVNALCPGPVNTPLLANCSPPTRNALPAGWCTCRSAGSPSPRRSPPRSRSWPATTHRSSRRRRSWWTVASPAPT